MRILYRPDAPAEYDPVTTETTWSRLLRFVRASALTTDHGARESRAMGLGASQV